MDYSPAATWSQILAFVLLKVAFIEQHWYYYYITHRSSPTGSLLIPLGVGKG